MEEKRERGFGVNIENSGSDFSTLGRTSTRFRSVKMIIGELRTIYINKYGIFEMNNPSKDSKSQN